MLGSLSEADDAVQESLAAPQPADTSEVENLSGWLTTVVARRVPEHAALAPDAAARSRWTSACPTRS